MAKAKKITSDTQIPIKPNSKSKTYEINSDSVITVELLPAFSEKHYSYYTCNYMKIDNDLVIDTLFYTKNNTIKIVTNKIVNYFNSSCNHIVKNKYSDGSGYQEITPDSKDVYIQVFNDADYENRYVHFIGTNNSDTYQLGYASSSIYNKKGNDTYNLQNETVYVRGADIIELSGNDTYNTIEHMGLYVYDYKGNDTYNLKNSTTRQDIKDYKGKDNYTLNNLKLVFVYDKGKENDKYNVSNCDLYESDDFEIYDKNGNETYDVTNVVFKRENFNPNDEYYAITDDNGKDTYNLNGVGYAKFKDLKGNDKYTLAEGSNNSFITDNRGKDTYNLSGTYDENTKEYTYITNINIEDSGLGKDKYKIQYTESFDIHDYSTSACNDSYDIVYSNGDIYDSKGNDTYTISNLRENYGISIADNNGKKDKLILKDVNKNDLFVIADIKKNGNYRMGSLLLFDQKTYGFVELTGYYHTDGSGDIDGTANGKIETIKAENQKVNASGADVYGDFNAIRGDVADWLSGGGNQGEFASVSDLFASADNGAIQTFIANFSNNQ